jgi:hypothetical protein
MGGGGVHDRLIPLAKARSTTSMERVAMCLSHRVAAGSAVSILFAALVLVAGPALADPCEAPVGRFKAGQEFSGPVRYVGDGDSICVGPRRDPATWVEVRLSDFYAPELREPGGEAAKRTMIGLTRGRDARCTAVIGDHGRAVSYDRVIAVCSVGGVSLGDLMRRASVGEGGRGAPSRGVAGRGR